MIPEVGVLCDSSISPAQNKPWHRGVNYLLNECRSITDHHITQIGLSLLPSGAACTMASADLICAAIGSLGPSPLVPLMALASSQ